MHRMGPRAIKDYIFKVFTKLPESRNKWNQSFIGRGHLRLLVYHIKAKLSRQPFSFSVLSSAKNWASASLSSGKLVAFKGKISGKNCAINCPIQGVRLIWKQKIWLAICEFLWSLTNQNAWFVISFCTYQSFLTSTCCTNFVLLY